MNESQFYALMILCIVIAGCSYGLGLIVGAVNERARISEALRKEK